EDGIRDRTVTGVQTCALPISGSRLALVPEPQNEHDPNAIGIWDAEERVQAGYVPAEVARELQAEEWQAVALREFFEGERRIGLQIGRASCREGAVGWVAAASW